MRVKVRVPRGLSLLPPETVRAAARALGIFARDRLTQGAQTRLNTTATTYIRGLNEADSLVVNDSSATLTLQGKLPNALERGSGPFDMKKMLRGKKYVNVPIQHGTPGSTNRKPMPSADHSVMQSVVKQAKAAMGNKPFSARGPKNMPSPAREKVTSFGTYKQKGSPTGSMVYQKHAYGKGSQGTYTTFRRLSRASDPASWIHPGFKALNLFPTVANEVKSLGPKLVRDYLRQGIR